MKRELFWILCACNLLAGCSARATTVLAYTTTVVGVIDGDTIVITNKSGPGGAFIRYNGRIELDAIDCPEVGQPGGLDAKLFIEDLLVGQEISVLELVDAGKSGGGWVFLASKTAEKGSTNVNLLMLQKGHAWSTKVRVRTKKTPRSTESFQSEAQKQKLGIWKSHNTVPPGEWRKNTHDQGEQPGDKHDSISQ